MALGFATCTGAVHAQVGVAVDGSSSAVVRLGDPFEITASAPAGADTYLLFDLDPGPTTLFNRSIPIGFSPFAAVVALGPMPATGTLAVPATAPSRDRLHGLRLHFAVVTLGPGGLDVSAGADVTLTARPELAGRALGAYPWFEHTLAIAAGSPVELGVDPRFALLSGATVDAWVVASKTAAEWRADPTLVDARGASQAVTFQAGAASIQSWTFTLDTGLLPGPDEAPGSGDTRIGVGYDVVLDLDRDGLFDDGLDLIDGFDDARAGFYIVRDTVRGGTQAAPGDGPHPVTEIQYSGGSFLGQDTWFPSNIASLGQRPLVVVSHGNGHQFTWYDHIGYHLASFGYVVMSHQNETMPGSHTAAATTIANTDFLLGNLATIGGGVLDGHVDASRIVWIGHSRGGDGVVRAYDQLFRGVTTPTNFSIADIRLVSSIAPVDFGGFEGLAPQLGGFGNGSNPHDATYSLIVSQADSDVHGCANLASTGWYHLHERATHARQSISLYGAGHADFHTGSTQPFAAGPNLVGKAAVHDILRGYLLPLVAHHIEGDIVARDFLWRQWESFRPIGAPVGTGVVVNLMYRGDPDDRYVIDDFQDQAFVNPGLATSGAAVSIQVANFVEGRAADCDASFDGLAIDPFNGLTHDEFRGNGEYRSESFACTFEFTSDASIVYDLTTIAEPPRFDRFEYLSLRAAQITRHPLTDATLGDLTFSVSLEDAAGQRSTIDIGVYGGGIEQPYRRNALPPCGAGVGWTSDYETIRIRLTDFLADASGLDLSAITELAFEFGPSHGSPQGRIALDEIELTEERR